MTRADTWERIADRFAKGIRILIIKGGDHPEDFLPLTLCLWCSSGSRGYGCSSDPPRHVVVDQKGVLCTALVLPQRVLRDEGCHVA